MINIPFQPWRIGNEIEILKIESLNINKAEMKTKIFILLICNLFICNLLISQNINGKLGTGGQFILRDTNNTFLTLQQSTGYLSLNRSLVLANTTGSSIGVIYKGADRLFHNYGIGNIFFGINSGNFSTTGLNNTAFGNETLDNNTTGIFNTAVGLQSLTANTTGDNNTSIGYFSMGANTTGDNNTSVGQLSLSGNNIGSGNTAVGFNALSSSSSGSNNTAFGNNAGGNISIGSNNIAIGNGSNVPNGLGSNQVRIGNTSITYAGIQVAWTVTSDKRLKTNIQNSVLGLGFISKLRPVSYTRINNDMHTTEYGFISQEVDEVLKELSQENTGVVSVDDEGIYSLRYNDLIAPMVKAIQELKSENEILRNENNGLEQRLKKLEDILISKTVNADNSNEQ